MMYIKRYTIAVALLVGVVGWYIHTYLTKETMSIDFFGYQLPELAIFLWVLVPVIVLYIASVIHMAFYSLLIRLKNRMYEKDAQKLVDSIIDAYLGKKDRKNEFKTERYKLLGSLIDNTTLTAHSSISRTGSNQKLNEVVTLIENINNGKTVDLKAYLLDATNELSIKNNKNRYDNKEITAEEIVTNADNYDKELVKDAYVEYVKMVSLENIEKYQDYITKTALFEILKRVNVEENSLLISNELLTSLFEKLDLDGKDYIDISIALSKGMIPEQRIKLFETLSEKSDLYMKAYLFTLFDLEMNSLATDILNNSQPEEYMRFKAYNALKESHKNFNINLFI